MTGLSYKCFDNWLQYHKEFPVANISLALPGVHNVLNSLAVSVFYHYFIWLKIIHLNMLHDL